MAIDYADHGAHPVIVMDSGETATSSVVPAPEQLVLESDTGLFKLGDGLTKVSALDHVPAPGGGGGSSDALPIADPTGVTVETADNPVTGEGTINVLTFPTDTPAFAIKLAGDDFPRWLFESDAAGGIYMGDGTFDPYNGDAANIFYDSGGMVIFGGAGLDFDGGTGNIKCETDVEFRSADHGPIVVDDADGHTYRVGSSNGAVTLTLVT